MAKVKENPKRLPLSLSFVEGELAMLCLVTDEVTRVRERFPEDEKGALIAPDLYLEALCEAVVVSAGGEDDGKPVFAEGQVHGLFEPWRREAVQRVADAYTPAPKKDSAGATTSPAF